MWRRAARALAAGLVGTAVMTATMRLEAALRKDRPMPVDYDATDHVVTAAATVMHHRPANHHEQKAMYLAAHWGYGPAVALAYPLLSRALPGRGALALFVLAQSTAFAMFPLLGRTPPPWRWRRDILASSVAQHAVYVTAVAGADRMLRPR